MKELSLKERVLKALEHKEPDKVPIDFGGVHTSLHKKAHQDLAKLLKLDAKKAEIQDIFQQIVYPNEEIIKLFESDVVGVYPNTPDGWKLKINKGKDDFLDEWGNLWIKPKNGFFYDLEEPAMKDFTIKDLKNYKFPDPLDEGRVRGLRDKVMDLYKNTNKAIIMFNPTVGIWENLWFLRGFEQAYMDLVLNVKFVKLLFEKLLWWQKAFWDNALKEVGDLVNVVTLSDDLGTTDAPMFNPKLYRSLLKPLHKDLVSFIKSKTKAKVYMHSCGSVNWVIRDFIDCGIDILNPVQVSAKDMDSDILKKEFGSEIIFWGGGCDPRNLLSGSEKDVENEVKKRIQDFSPGGGFVFASVHNTQANTPPENMVAMYRTTVKNRNY